jgi:hypothetical protein
VPTAQNTFKDYIVTQGETTKQLLKYFHWAPRGEKTLKQCLSVNTKLKTASDGLYDECLDLASFGWLLIGNGNVVVKGAGPVDGVSNLMSSTRAELFGYGGLIEFLYQFMRYSGLQPRPVK